MTTRPGMWEDTAGRNSPDSLDFENEVGRRGFVDRSLGWKGSRGHSLRPPEEGRKTGFEIRNYVGKVGHKRQTAPQDMVAVVANRLDSEGIATGLGWADRTASCYGLGRHPGLFAASTGLNRIGRLQIRTDSMAVGMMAGTMPEELVQNTRRRRSLHRRYCIQSSDADSEVAAIRCPKSKWEHLDVRMSHDGRQRRNLDQRLDLPADDFQSDRHNLGTRLSVVMNAVVAGCEAFRYQGVLRPTVPQVHLRHRLHGHHSHESFVQGARSLLGLLNRLGHACLACQKQGPRSSRSVRGWLAEQDRGSPRESLGQHLGSCLLLRFDLGLKTLVAFGMGRR